MVNIEEWIPVNQGAFEEGVWNNIQLPIADDWFSWFEYLPQITKLIFVNDNDNGSGIVYFDSLYNMWMMTDNQICSRINHMMTDFNIPHMRYIYPGSIIFIFSKILLSLNKPAG